MADSATASPLRPPPWAATGASSSRQGSRSLVVNEEEGSSDSSSEDRDKTTPRGGGLCLWGGSYSPVRALQTPIGRSLVLLFLWVLVGVVGLHCFGRREERLHWVDTVYLMCQIITTVGYGDLPPPVSRFGYAFYSFYVLSACMLVAKVVSTFVVSAVDVKEAAGDEQDVTQTVSGGVSGILHRLGPRFASFVKASAVWVFFVLSWGAFFTFCPGEERPVSESLYMGVITLTTVGFGDRVPRTEPGKLFASLWMLLGTGAFTIMIGKFGVWTFFLFNKLSVDKLDNRALHRIMDSRLFQGVATARAKAIGQLLQGFELEKYHEVSKAYSQKISRNDFLMFMLLDMGLVDVDMVGTLSAHFDSLDVTGEGYIDRDDLQKAIQDEML